MEEGFGGGVIGEESENIGALEESRSSEDFFAGECGEGIDGGERELNIFQSGHRNAERCGEGRSGFSGDFLGVG